MRNRFGGRKKTVAGRQFPTSAGRGRGGGGYSSFRKGSMPGGAGGPGALQTSSAGETVPGRKFPTSAVRGQGRGGYSSFRKGLMPGGAGGPDALQTSSDGRRQYRNGYFRLLWCAGGAEVDIRASARVRCSGELEGRTPSRPLAPVRSQESVDTNPHAALRALHCRAMPGNSSIAGAAPLDSVRLRRNRSLLLCVTQSSPLTCARGAYRA